MDLTTISLILKGNILKEKLFYNILLPVIYNIYKRLLNI